MICVACCVDCKASLNCIGCVLYTCIYNFISVLNNNNNKRHHDMDNYLKIEKLFTNAKFYKQADTSYKQQTTSQTMIETTSSKNPVFRFNLSYGMVDALLHFSKTHQFDDRHSYTDAWNEWKNNTDISKIINDEIQRLQNLDYKGSAESIERKIFKSGRYYFRNKSFVKVPPKSRGNYISVSKELICAMDDHISRGTINNNGQVQVPSPADLFNDFCSKYVDILKMEIERLIEVEPFTEDPALIIAKVKKTYKNRVFRGTRRGPIVEPMFS